MEHGTLVDFSDCLKPNLGVLTRDETLAGGFEYHCNIEPLQHYIPLPAFSSIRVTHHGFSR